MIENKIRKKQIFGIYDKLLKKFLIVYIFRTINRDDLEKNKNSFIVITKKIKNKRKEKKEIRNENECKGLLFTDKITIKNK